MNSSTILVVACTSLVLVSCATTASDPDDPQTYRADGTITLSVRMSGSRSRDAGSVETANLQASADYTFDLQIVEVEEQSGTRTVNWDQETLTGSATWSDERLKTYDCNASSVTDRTLTSRSVSFGSSGDVIGGAMLIIEGTGAYQLAVSATPLRSLGTEIVETWENCGGTRYDRQEHAWSVPFLELFMPLGPGQGAFPGNLADPSAKTVAGSYSGSQEFTVFSDGTEITTIPITYTVSWNLRLDR